MERSVIGYPRVRSDDKLTNAQRQYFCIASNFIDRDSSWRPSVIDTRHARDGNKRTHTSVQTSCALFLLISHSSVQFIVKNINHPFDALINRHL